MTVTELVRQYLAWCERHRSEGTVSKYQPIMNSLAAMFGDREFVGLRPLEIDEWLHAQNHHADGREKARATRASNATAFLRLQNWAIHTAGILNENDKVVKSLEKPKSAPRRTMPTNEELEQVLAVASPEFTRIIHALEWSGARPSELAAATIQDYDKADSLIVLNKHKTDRTGRNRMLYVSQKLAALIAESLSGRPPELLTPESRLFLTGENIPWTGQRLTNTWRRLRHKTGINPRARLYDIRHRFCTRVAGEYGIVEAQELAGHSSISTTQLYVHAQKERLLDIVNSL
jgi:integrase/recombinase XerD